MVICSGGSRVCNFGKRSSITEWRCNFSNWRWVSYWCSEFSYWSSYDWCYGFGNNWSSYTNRFLAYNSIETVDWISGIVYSSFGTIRVYYGIRAFYSITVTSFMLAFAISGESILNVVCVRILGIWIVLFLYNSFSYSYRCSYFSIWWGVGDWGSGDFGNWGGICEMSWWSVGNWSWSGICDWGSKFSNGWCSITDCWRGGISSTDYTCPCDSYKRNESKYLEEWYNNKRIRYLLQI